MSPHLAFGEIGPAQIWRAVSALQPAARAAGRGAEVFLSEIAWREFSYVLAFHNPDLANANYNKTFDAMPWRTDAEALSAWQRRANRISDCRRRDAAALANRLDA